MTRTELWRRLGISGGDGGDGTSGGSPPPEGPQARWPDRFVSAGPCEARDALHSEEPRRGWNGRPWFSETPAKLRKDGHAPPKIRIISPPGDSLREERKKLAASLHKGISCLLCGRNNKLYERSVNGAQVAGLLLIAQWFRLVWRGAPDLEKFGVRDTAGSWWLKYQSYFGTLDNAPYSAKGGGTVAKMRFYGLIENLEAERPDGSTRNGHWRLTEMGRAFVENKMPIPSKYIEWNNRLYALAGRPRSAGDLLGKDFDWSADMGETGLWAGVE